MLNSPLDAFPRRGGRIFFVSVIGGAREQVVTTNLELAQQRVSKSEAELDRTKLSLREAREEVQKAARDSVEAVSKSEHRKLLEEVCMYVCMYVCENACCFGDPGPVWHILKSLRTILISS